METVNPIQYLNDFFRDVSRILSCENNPQSIQSAVVDLKKKNVELGHRLTDKQRAELLGKIRGLEANDRILRYALGQINKTLSDLIVARQSFASDSDYLSFLLLTIRTILSKSDWKEDVVEELSTRINSLETALFDAENRYVRCRVDFMDLVGLSDSEDFETAVREYKDYIDNLEKDARIYRYLLKTGAIKQVTGRTDVVFSNEPFHTTIEGI